MTSRWPVLVLALLSAGAAFGQELYGPPAPTVVESAGSVGTTLVSTPTPDPLSFKTGGAGTGQVSLYLALLLAVVGGGFFVLRNGAAIFQPKAKGERKLNISETRMLGNRQFLVVAEYQDRRVLLGVCPGRIEYLCALGSGESEFPKISPEGPDA